MSSKALNPRSRSAVEHNSQPCQLVVEGTLHMKLCSLLCVIWRRDGGTQYGGGGAWLTKSLQPHHLLPFRARRGQMSLDVEADVYESLDDFMMLCSKVGTARPRDQTTRTRRSEFVVTGFAFRVSTAPSKKTLRPACMTSAVDP